jgi:hypothetical protein
MLNIFTSHTDAKDQKYNKELVLKNALALLDKLSHKQLKHLSVLKSYTYDPQLAVEELGLDEELIYQLVDDYISQILHSILEFESYLKELKNSKNGKKQLNFTPFRELAHKNLGVARNLRIKDGEILLYELMTNDDLEYLIHCLEALYASVIRLDATHACKTLKLIEVKNSILNCC